MTDHTNLQKPDSELDAAAVSFVESAHAVTRVSSLEIVETSQALLKAVLISRRRVSRGNRAAVKKGTKTRGQENKRVRG